MTTYKCPKCGSQDLKVEVSGLSGLVQENDEVSVTASKDYDWGGDSYMRCEDCGFDSIASVFKAELELTSPLPIEDELSSFKVLNISTCHMEEEDNDNLFGVSCANATDGGWIISTACLLDVGLSPSLAYIMLSAKTLGYDYVWFDSDGEVYDESIFPIFNW